MRHFVLLFAFIVGVPFLFSGCGSQPAPPENGEQPEQAAKQSKDTAETPKDIVDTAVASHDFKTLVAAVQAAGLVDTLKGDGPFTVFAPTDAAFDTLPAGKLDELLKPENKDQLTAILTYHVMPGKVMAAQVVGMDAAETVQGAEVAITASGGSVKVNEANVTATDIDCANGVIHVIDAVIFPPEPEQEAKDVVDTAVASDDFTTLVAAVEAAGLVDTLKGDGPFTVFAPTDAAFDNLPAGTLDELLEPENGDKLTSILTYHVVPGKVMAAEVVGMDAAETIQGAEVAIAAEGGSVKLNDANVTATDIECVNGVIHVIDAVLLPPSE
jgi:uncharacterized surface protein with fasciclin (FAS1) repeats